MSFPKNQSNLLQGGFSLVEVLIAAGMLGIVATGAMTLFENMSKSQKTIDMKSLKENIRYELTLALRDNVACERTFASKVPTTPPPPNPAAINSPALTPPANPASVAIPIIYNRIGGPVITLNQIISGTTSRIQIASIDVFNPASSTCGLDQECPLVLQVDILNLGKGSGTGGGSLQNAYVRQRETLAFPVRFKRWGPSYPVGTPGINDALVDECLSADTAYIDEACTSMGGLMNGGACQRLRITAVGGSATTTMGDTVAGLTVEPDMQVKRDSYINRGLIIGSGPSAASGGLGVGTGAPGIGRALIANSLGVGTGDSGVTGDVSVGRNLLVSGTTTSTGLITGNNGATINNAGLIVNGVTANNYVLINSTAGNDALEVSGGGDVTVNGGGDVTVNNGGDLRLTTTASTLAFAGTTLQDTAARNLEISSDIITFLDNSPIFNVRSSGASNPQLRLERNNGANNFVFDFRNNQDLYITSTHLTPRIFILEDRMTPDDYSQVATRDYIKNLLVGDVDQQAWDLVITNIINTIYGAADYVMGDAIARYVCGRFRLTRPVATGQAASDFSWTGSDCENIDYWDNVIELSCTTGMYLNSVTGAGSFTCTQWPASPATPSANVTATPIGFPAPYRFLEHCIIIGTNRAGDITCLRKRFYIRDTSCCTCACADPVTITNVCAALGGGGFYDPAVTNIVQCYGSTIAAMADDQATSATGQVYIAGPPPECGADHEFRIQDCDRTAASVQAE